MIVRLRWADGRVREWDNWTGMPSLAEARVIKQHIKMTMTEFQDGLQDMDPDCLTGMLYVLYRRDGDMVTWDEIDCDFGADEPREGVPLVELVHDDAEAAEEPKGSGKASSTPSGRKKKAG